MLWPRKGKKIKEDQVEFNALIFVSHFRVFLLIQIRQMEVLLGNFKLYKRANKFVKVWLLLSIWRKKIVKVCLLPSIWRKKSWKFVYSLQFDEKESWKFVYSLQFDEKIRESLFTPFNLTKKISDELFGTWKFKLFFGPKIAKINGLARDRTGDLLRVKQTW